jgi:hypothetical protein
MSVLQTPLPHSPHVTAEGDEVKRPAVHATQDDCPLEDCALPASHGTQARRPVVLPNLPASQSRHCSNPSSGAYFPRGQLVQLVDWTVEVNDCTKTTSNQREKHAPAGWKRHQDGEIASRTCGVVLTPAEHLIHSSAPV